MAEFFRHLADIFQTDLLKRQQQQQKDLAQSLADAAEESHGDPTLIAQITQDHPIQALNRVLHSLSGIDQIADLLEAAGITDLDASQSQQIIQLLTPTPVTTPKTDSFSAPKTSDSPPTQSPPELTPPRHLVDQYEQISPLTVPQLINEGVLIENEDFIIRGGGPKRTWRFLTPAGVAKVLAHVGVNTPEIYPGPSPYSPPQEAVISLQAPETPPLHSPRSYAPYLIIQLDPDTGQFLHGTLDSAAGALKEKFSQEFSRHDLRTIRSSNLSEAKATLNIGLRNLAEKHQLTTISEVISIKLAELTGFESGWTEVYHYLNDHYGRLTVEEFISTVTNRFSQPQEWNPAANFLPTSLLKHNRPLQDILGPLTPGAHYRVTTQNQVEFSPEGTILARNALDKIQVKRPSDERFTTSLIIAVQEHLDRNRALKHLTWNGNLQAFSFLRYSPQRQRSFLERIESDCLTYLSEPDSQTVEAIARHHHIIQGPIPQTEDDELLPTSYPPTPIHAWIAHRIQEDAHQQKHSTPFEADTEKRARAENYIFFQGLLDTDLSPSTEGTIRAFLSPDTPPMCGYKLMLALILEVNKNSTARAKFWELIQEYYNGH